MKEISDVKKYLKAEDKANLLLYKAMGKMYNRLEKKFMWDLKIIDKMWIEVDPWNEELAIFPHSTMKADEEEYAVYAETVGKWRITVRAYNDFLKIRPNYMQEVIQWGFNNVINHFDSKDKIIA